MDAFVDIFIENSGFPFDASNFDILMFQSARIDSAKPAQSLLPQVDGKPVTYDPLLGLNADEPDFAVTR